MARLTFGGSNKASGRRNKMSWQEAGVFPQQSQRTGQRPADPRRTDWRPPGRYAPAHATLQAQGQANAQDNGRSEQLGLQSTFKQQQANEYAMARYSALLRERFLSNIMGPRRNNYDVGINEISTLDAYNRMWGSSSVTEQERLLRQNAAPPGMMWTPYGYQGKTAYVPIGMSNPGEKKMKSAYGPGSPYYSGNTGSGGGGGYGYNDWGTGGGGGGGTTNKNNLFSDLMTWKIK